MQWGEVLDEMTSLQQRIEGITREFAISLVWQTEHTPTASFDIEVSGEITFNLPPAYAIKLMTSLVSHATSYVMMAAAYTEEMIAGFFIHTGFDSIDAGLEGVDQDPPVFYDEDMLVAMGITAITSDGTPANSIQYNFVPSQIILGSSGVIPPLNRLLYTGNHSNNDVAGANGVDVWTFVTVTFGIAQLSQANAASRVWEQVNEQ